MFNFIHDIEWMRTYSRKNRKKKHTKNVRKNYRQIYKEIKWHAKMGLNEVNIRFTIYEENVRRLVSEGYSVEKYCYTSGSGWKIRW